MAAEARQAPAERDAPRQEWWVASLGSLLVWARLSIHGSGVADVFDCDGNTLTYDSADSAIAALMDSEFRAYDGLDEDDAAQMGFDLGSVAPPAARDDAQLRERMTQALPRQQ